MKLRSLSENPHEALSMAVAELEKDIINAPWQWWQWGMFNHSWSPAATTGEN